MPNHSTAKTENRAFGTVTVLFLWCTGILSLVVGLALFIADLLFDTIPLSGAVVASALMLIGILGLVVVERDMRLREAEGERERLLVLVLLSEVSGQSVDDIPNDFVVQEGQLVSMKQNSYLLRRE